MSSAGSAGQCDPLRTDLIGFCWVVAWSLEGDDGLAPSKSAAAAKPAKPMIEWGQGEVGSFLDAYGLGELKDAFQKHKVTGETLYDLEKSDLSDMGITSVGRLCVCLCLLSLTRMMPCCFHRAVAGTVKKLFKSIAKSIAEEKKGDGLLAIVLPEPIPLIPCARTPLP